jgi:predicted alpha/beta hydrolase
VILCGGYACNRHFLDYDEQYSLARFLARAGFDAWVLELRGRGMSHPAPGRRPSWSWTFDDLAALDVPAAIEHVARATGRSVAWVGHSMGGMLLYAYCGRGREPAAPLGAAVTIAAPVGFDGFAPEILSRVGLLALSVPVSDLIHQRWALGALWALLRHSPVLSIGMNPDNVDRPTVGRALRLSIENVPRAKLQQFARWAHEGVFCSVDGAVDYRAGLGRVGVPVLVIGGSVDRLATPAAVARALEHLPARRATYLEFGRAHGHGTDYGHVDIVLGRSAPAEVFPAVAGWLTAHMG